MKQKLYFTASLLLLGAAMSVQAETTIPHEMRGSNVTFGRAVAGRHAKAREYAGDIDIRLKVRYDKSKYDYMQICCMNDLWSFVTDEVDMESDGYIHIYDIPGNYDFVAILTHAGKDGTTLVIKENVEVSEGSVIEFDASSATEHIRFRPVTDAGLDLAGDVVEDDEIIEKGVALSGLSFTEIYNSRRGRVMHTTAFMDAFMTDGKMEYGPQQADIFVNPLGDRSAYSFVQTRMAVTYDGTYIVKLMADGTASQTVTNKPDSYVSSSHSFADHRFGNDFIQSIPDVKATLTYGYIPVWDGEIYNECLLHDCFTTELPNAGKLYLSASPSGNPECPYDILAVFGTYDNLDAQGSGFSGAGFGVTTAPLRISADNRMELLDNAAVNGLRYDEWTFSEDYYIPNTDAFSDYLASSADDGAHITWGNTAPICVASVGYRKNSTSRLHFSFVGRNGENRNIDNINTLFEMKANGTVISNSIYKAESDFDNWRLRDGEFNETDAEYKITIENSNVIVDGLPGHNKTTIYYDTNFTLGNPPALRSLQFRDKDGCITDRFSSFDDAVVELYAGDFEFSRKEDSFNWFFNYVNLSEVIVEYSPYGADEWNTLYVDEVPEMLAPVAYGALYRGSLADVTEESESGWYDLRIKLIDCSDNYQLQEISPAFCKMDPDSVNSLQPDMSGMVVDVYNTGGVLVYRGDYENCMNADLPQGVYIVKSISTNSVPTRKLIIK